MRCGCNSAPWSCSWVAVLLRLALAETSWTASSVAASSPLSDPEGTAADDGCEVPPLDGTHWAVELAGRVHGGSAPPSTSSNPRRRVASILQTLHTITVRRAIQDLYSIHCRQPANPGHDIERLLTKYRGGLEELLAAVHVKYEPVTMLAAVLPSRVAQLYQEAFFGAKRVGSEYLVAASSSGAQR
eukprot:COSAG06_NODE_2723_length_6385_cov_7.707286_1_plen_186_part_00